MKEHIEDRSQKPEARSQKSNAGLLFSPSPSAHPPIRSSAYLLITSALGEWIWDIFRWTLSAKGLGETLSTLWTLMRLPVISLFHLCGVCDCKKPKVKELQSSRVQEFRNPTLQLPNSRDVYPLIL